jgi:hypothetical protein
VFGGASWSPACAEGAWSCTSKPAVTVRRPENRAVHANTLKSHDAIQSVAFDRLLTQLFQPERYDELRGAREIRPGAPIRPV